MRFASCFLLLVALIVSAVAVGPGRHETAAQNSGPQQTIEALETQVAELKGTSTARGKKINAQRTQIAEQNAEIADLRELVPPTSTPTPERSGKDAYTWVQVPAELDTRPFNHLDEKWVFCGVVQTIFVAGPGNAYFPGDNVSTGWQSLLQVRPDGHDNNFMVGFDGDSTGMYEGSYVCVWGTVVDTASFTNAFGGTISNTLFDAEFVELQ